jgi:hypothetical protein
MFAAGDRQIARLRCGAAFRYNRHQATPNLSNEAFPVSSLSVREWAYVTTTNG